MIVVDGVVQKAIVDHVIDFRAVMRRGREREMSGTNECISTASCAALPDLVNGNARQFLGNVLHCDSLRVRCDNERNCLCDLALSRV